MPKMFLVYETVTAKRMTTNPNQDRRQIYYQLNSQLTQMDNIQLRKLFATSESQAGWERSQTVKVEW